jgi:hypothetical protein
MAPLHEKTCRPGKTIKSRSNLQESYRNFASGRVNIVINCHKITYYLPSNGKNEMDLVLTSIKSKKRKIQKTLRQPLKGTGKPWWCC